MKTITKTMKTEEGKGNTMESAVTLSMVFLVPIVSIVHILLIW